MSLTSLQIKDLSTITTANLSAESFLLMSQGTNNALYSYKFTYDVLSNALKRELENVPNNTDDSQFNPKGIWQITNRGRLYTENNLEINGNIRKLTAINLSSIYKNYIKKLEELSAIYFSGNGVTEFPKTNTLIHDELFIPSYIGQIIVSSKLKSETDLQKIYGSDTRWQKISGRLLVGTGVMGKNLNNTLGKTEDITISRAKMYGGSPYVSIGDFVPRHSHCMANGYFEDNGLKVSIEGDTTGEIDNSSKGTLSFGEFPAADYHFFIFDCSESKDKQTSTTENDSDAETSETKGEGIEADYKGMLAYAYGQLRIGEGQHRAKWFLNNSKGDVRSKTMSTDKTFSYKVVGSFTTSGTKPEDVALIPSMPEVIVYYIWERTE